VHLACQAIIERSALVTTAFTVKGKQILHVRPAYRGIVDTEDGTPPSTPRLLLSADGPGPNGPRYWDEWPEHYDYVYLLFTESDADNPDPEHMTLVQDGTNFQLYRINKPGQASLAH
jgi:hypothetical protein